MKSSFAKIFTVILTTLFFINNCSFGYAIETNFWNERKKSLPSADEKIDSNFKVASLPLGTPAQIFQQLPSPLTSALSSAVSRRIEREIPTGFKSAYNPILKALSSQYGSIRKVVIPSVAKTATGQISRTIIHIQDIHLNSEAQANIRATVDKLIAGQHVDLIALEGAFSPVDLSKYRAFEDKEAVRIAADYLLKENKISGTVQAALTSPASIPPVIGIDEAVHYSNNVKAYQVSLPQAPVVKKQLASLQVAHGKTEAQILNPALKNFHAHVQSFRQASTSMGDYVQFLAQTSPLASANVEVFLEALKLERSLNFKQVETERTALLAQLLKKLSKDETTNLLNASIAYRLGNIRHTDFYQYLKDLCDKNEISLSRTPAMDSYIQYVLLSDGIDSEKLYAEMSAMEKDGYASFVKTEEERNLVAESTQLFLMGKLADFALTPEEWNEYKAAKAVIPTEAGIQVLNHSLNKVYGLDSRLRGNDDVKNIREINISSFESFYLEAEARNDAMTQNLLRAMDQNHAKVAVLVTGGFHSPGMDRLMNEAGLATISFAPKITQVNSESGTTYLSFFSQEKTPLDKLFQGEKLFVTPPPDDLREGGMAVTAIKQNRTPQDLGAAAKMVIAQLDPSVTEISTSHLGANAVRILLPKAHAVLKAVFSPKGSLLIIKVVGVLGAAYLLKDYALTAVHQSLRAGQVLLKLSVGTNPVVWIALLSMGVLIVSLSLRARTTLRASKNWKYVSSVVALLVAGLASANAQLGGGMNQIPTTNVDKIGQIGQLVSGNHWGIWPWVILGVSVLIVVTLLRMSQRGMGTQQSPYDELRLDFSLIQALVPPGKPALARIHSLILELNTLSQKYPMGSSIGNSLWEIMGHLGDAQALLQGQPKPGRYGTALSGGVFEPLPTTVPIFIDRIEAFSPEAASSLIQAAYGMRSLWKYKLSDLPVVEPRLPELMDAVRSLGQIPPRAVHDVTRSGWVLRILVALAIPVFAALSVEAQSGKDLKQEFNNDIWSFSDDANTKRIVALFHPDPNPYIDAIEANIKSTVEKIKSGELTKNEKSFDTCSALIDEASKYFPNQDVANFQKSLAYSTQGASMGKVGLTLESKLSFANAAVTAYEVTDSFYREMGLAVSGFMQAPYSLEEALQKVRGTRESDAFAKLVRDIHEKSGQSIVVTNTSYLRSQDITRFEGRDLKFTFAFTNKAAFSKANHFYFEGHTRGRLGEISLSRNSNHGWVIQGDPYDVAVEEDAQAKTITVVVGTTNRSSRFTSISFTAGNPDQKRGAPSTATIEPTDLVNGSSTSGLSKPVAPVILPCNLSKEYSSSVVGRWGELDEKETERVLIKGDVVHYQITMDRYSTANDLSLVLKGRGGDGQERDVFQVRLRKNADSVWSSPNKTITINQQGGVLDITFPFKGARLIHDIFNLSFHLQIKGYDSRIKATVEILGLPGTSASLNSNSPLNITSGFTAPPASLGIAKLRADNAAAKKANKMRSMVSTRGNTLKYVFSSWAMLLLAAVAASAQEVATSGLAYHVFTPVGLIQELMGAVIHLLVFIGVGLTTVTLFETNLKKSPALFFGVPTAIGFLLWSIGVGPVGIYDGIQTALAVFAGLSIYFLAKPLFLKGSWKTAAAVAIPVVMVVAIMQFLHLWPRTAARDEIRFQSLQTKIELDTNTHALPASDLPEAAASLWRRFNDAKTALNYNDPKTTEDLSQVLSDAKVLVGRWGRLARSQQRLKQIGGGLAQTKLGAVENDNPRSPLSKAVYKFGALNHMSTIVWMLIEGSDLLDREVDTKFWMNYLLLIPYGQIYSPSDGNPFQPSSFWNPITFLEQETQLHPNLSRIFKSVRSENGIWRATPRSVPVSAFQRLDTASSDPDIQSAAQTISLPTDVTRIVVAEPYTEVFSRGTGTIHGLSEKEAAAITESDHFDFVFPKFNRLPRNRDTLSADIRGDEELKSFHVSFEYRGGTWDLLGYRGRWSLSGLQEPVFKLMMNSGITLTEQGDDYVISVPGSVFRQYRELVGMTGLTLLRMYREGPNSNEDLDPEGTLTVFRIYPPMSTNPSSVQVPMSQPQDANRREPYKQVIRPGNTSPAEQKPGASITLPIAPQISFGLAKLLFTNAAAKKANGKNSLVTPRGENRKSWKYVSTVAALLVAGLTSIGAQTVNKTQQTPGNNEPSVSELVEKLKKLPNATVLVIPEPSMPWDLADPKIVPTITQALLSDKDYHVRETAAEALGKIGKPAAIPALIKAFEDESEDVRNAAVHSLSKIKDRSIEREMIKKLSHTNPRVRSCAAQVLGKIRAKSAKSILGTMLLSDSNADVRWAAGFALSLIGDKTDAPILMKALSDPYPDVRRVSLQALRWMGQIPAISDLNQFAKDSDSLVRESVVRCLKTKSDPAARLLIIQMIHDGDRFVRRTVVEALAETKDPAVIPVLVKALDDAESVVRDLLVSTLNDDFGVEVLPALVAAYGDHNESLRDGVFSTLMKSKRPEKIQVLINGLTDENTDVQTYSAFTLGELQAGKAVPVLVNLLDSKEVMVRRTAFVALDKIEDPRAIPAFKKLLQGTDDTMRTNAPIVIERLEKIERIMHRSELKSSDRNSESQTKEVPAKRHAGLSQPAAPLAAVGLAKLQAENAAAKKLSDLRSVVVSGNRWKYLFSITGILFMAGLSNLSAAELTGLSQTIDLPQLFIVRGLFIGCTLLVIIAGTLKFSASYLLAINEQGSRVRKIAISLSRTSVVTALVLFWVGNYLLFNRDNHLGKNNSSPTLTQKIYDQINLSTNLGVGEVALHTIYPVGEPLPIDSSKRGSDSWRVYVHPTNTVDKMVIEVQLYFEDPKNPQSKISNSPFEIIVRPPIGSEQKWSLVTYSPHYTAERAYDLGQGGNTNGIDVLRAPDGSYSFEFLESEFISPYLKNWSEGPLNLTRVGLRVHKVGEPVIQQVDHGYILIPQTQSQTNPTKPQARFFHNWWAPKSVGVIGALLVSALVVTARETSSTIVVETAKASTQSFGWVVGAAFVFLAAVLAFGIPFRRAMQRRTQYLLQTELARQQRVKLLAGARGISRINPVVIAALALVTMLADSVTAQIKPRMQSLADAVALVRYQTTNNSPAGEMFYLPSSFTVPTNVTNYYRDLGQKRVIDEGVELSDLALSVLALLKTGDAGDFQLAKNIMNVLASSQNGDMNIRADNFANYFPFNSGTNYLFSLMRKSGHWDSSWNFWNTRTGDNALNLLAVSKFVEKEKSLHEDPSAEILSLGHTTAEGVLALQNSDGGIRQEPGTNYLEYLYNFVSIPQNAVAFSGLTAWSNITTNTTDKARYATAANKIWSFVTQTPVQVLPFGVPSYTQTGFLHNDGTNVYFYPSANFDDSHHYLIYPGLITTDAGVTTVQSFGVDRIDQAYTNLTTFQILQTLRNNNGLTTNFTHSGLTGRLDGFDYSNQYLYEDPILATNGLISTQMSDPGVYREVVDHYSRQQIFDHTGPTVDQMSVMTADYFSLWANLRSNPNSMSEAYGPGLLPPRWGIAVLDWWFVPLDSQVLYLGSILPYLGSPLVQAREATTVGTNVFGFSQFLAKEQSQLDDFGYMTYYSPSTGNGSFHEITPSANGEITYTRVINKGTSLALESVTKKGGAMTNSISIILDPTQTTITTLAGSTNFAGAQNPSDATRLFVGHNTNGVNTVFIDFPSWFENLLPADVKQSITNAPFKFWDSVYNKTAQALPFGKSGDTYSRKQFKTLLAQADINKKSEKRRTILGATARATSTKIVVEPAKASTHAFGWVVNAALVFLSAIQVFGISFRRAMQRRAQYLLQTELARHRKEKLLAGARGISRINPVLMAALALVTVLADSVTAQINPRVQSLVDAVAVVRFQLTNNITPIVNFALPPSFYVPTNIANYYRDLGHKQAIDDGVELMDSALSVLALLKTGDAGDLELAKNILRVHASGWYGEIKIRADDPVNYYPFNSETNYLLSLIDKSGHAGTNWNNWGARTGDNAMELLAVAKLAERERSLGEDPENYILSLGHSLAEGILALQNSDGGIRQEPRKADYSSLYTIYSIPQNATAFSALIAWSKVVTDANDRARYVTAAEKIWSFVTDTEVWVIPPYAVSYSQKGFLHNDGTDVYFYSAMSGDGTNQAKIVYPDFPTTDGGGITTIQGFGVDRIDQAYTNLTTFQILQTLRNYIGLTTNFTHSGLTGRVDGFDYVQPFAGLDPTPETSGLISPQMSDPGVYREVVDHYSRQQIFDHTGPTVDQMASMTADFFSQWATLRSNPNSMSEAYGPGLLSPRLGNAIGNWWYVPLDSQVLYLGSILPYLGSPLVQAREATTVGTNVFGFSQFLAKLQSRLDDDGYMTYYSPSSGNGSLHEFTANDKGETTYTRVINKGTSLALESVTKKGDVVTNSVSIILSPISATITTLAGSTNFAGAQNPSSATTLYVRHGTNGVNTIYLDFPSWFENLLPPAVKQSITNAPFRFWSSVSKGTALVLPVGKPGNTYSRQQFKTLLAQTDTDERTPLALKSNRDETEKGVRAAEKTHTDMSRGILRRNKGWMGVAAGLFITILGALPSMAAQVGAAATSHPILPGLVILEVLKYMLYGFGVTLGVFGLGYLLLKANKVAPLPETALFTATSLCVFIVIITLGAGAMPAIVVTAVVTPSVFAFIHHEIRIRSTRVSGVANQLSQGQKIKSLFAAYILTGLPVFAGVFLALTYGLTAVVIGGVLTCLFVWIHNRIINNKFQSRVHSLESIDRLARAFTPPAYEFGPVDKRDSISIASLLLSLPTTENMFWLDVMHQQTVTPSPLLPEFEWALSNVEEAFRTNLSGVGYRGNTSYATDNLAEWSMYWYATLGLGSGKYNRVRPLLLFIYEVARARTDSQLRLFDKRTRFISEAKKVLGQLGKLHYSEEDLKPVIAEISDRVQKQNQLDTTLAHFLPHQLGTNFLGALDWTVFRLFDGMFDDPEFLDSVYDSTHLSTHEKMALKFLAQAWVAHQDNPKIAPRMDHDPEGREQEPASSVATGFEGHEKGIVRKLIVGDDMPEFWASLRGDGGDAWLKGKLPVVMALVVAKEPISIDQVMQFSGVQDRALVETTIRHIGLLLEEIVINPATSPINLYFPTLAFREFVKAKEGQEAGVDFKTANEKAADSILAKIPGWKRTAPIVAILFVSALSSMGVEVGQKAANELNHPVLALLTVVLLVTLLVINRAAKKYFINRYGRRFTWEKLLRFSYRELISTVTQVLTFSKNSVPTPPANYQEFRRQPGQQWLQAWMVAVRSGKVPVKKTSFGKASVTLNDGSIISYIPSEGLLALTPIGQKTQYFLPLEKGVLTVSPHELTRAVPLDRTTSPQALSPLSEPKANPFQKWTGKGLSYLLLGLGSLYLANPASALAGHISSVVRPTTLGIPTDYFYIAAIVVLILAVVVVNGFQFLSSRINIGRGSRELRDVVSFLNGLEIQREDFRKSTPEERRQSLKLKIGIVKETPYSEIQVVSSGSSDGVVKIEVPETMDPLAILIVFKTRVFGLADDLEISMAPAQADQIEMRIQELLHRQEDASRQRDQHRGRGPISIFWLTILSLAGAGGLQAATGPLLAALSSFERPPFTMTGAVVTNLVNPSDDHLDLRAPTIAPQKGADVEYLKKVLALQDVNLLFELARELGETDQSPHAKDVRLMMNDFLRRAMNDATSVSLLGSYAPMDTKIDPHTLLPHLRIQPSLLDTLRKLGLQMVESHPQQVRVMLDFVKALLLKESVHFANPEPLRLLNWNFASVTNAVSSLPQNDPQRKLLERSHLAGRMSVEMSGQISMMLFLADQDWNLERIQSVLTALEGPFRNTGESFSAMFKELERDWVTLNIDGLRKGNGQDLRNITVQIFKRFFVPAARTGEGYAEYIRDAVEWEKQEGRITDKKGELIYADDAFPWLTQPDYIKRGLSADPTHAKPIGTSTNSPSAADSPTTSVRTLIARYANSPRIDFSDLSKIQQSNPQLAEKIATQLAKGLGIVEAMNRSAFVSGLVDKRMTLEVTNDTIFVSGPENGSDIAVPIVNIDRLWLAVLENDLQFNSLPNDGGPTSQQAWMNLAGETSITRVGDIAASRVREALNGNLQQAVKGSPSEAVSTLIGSQMKAERAFEQTLKKYLAEYPGDVAAETIKDARFRFLHNAILVANRARIIHEAGIFDRAPHAAPVKPTQLEGSSTNKSPTTPSGSKSGVGGQPNDSAALPVNSTGSTPRRRGGEGGSGDGKRQLGPDDLPALARPVAQGIVENKNGHLTAEALARITEVGIIGVEGQGGLRGLPRYQQAEFFALVDQFVGESLKGEKLNLTPDESLNLAQDVAEPLDATSKSEVGEMNYTLAMPGSTDEDYALMLERAHELIRQPYFNKQGVQRVLNLKIHDADFALLSKAFGDLQDRVNLIPGHRSFYRDVAGLVADLNDTPEGRILLGNSILVIPNANSNSEAIPINLRAGVRVATLANLLMGSPEGVDVGLMISIYQIIQKHA